jgi:arsenate reductase-like glutaredoxin family protein
MITIYYNHRCLKSCEALTLLQQYGPDNVDVVEYLK